MRYENLNPKKALIFRIEHIDNLLWNLTENALYCRSSGKVNPTYVNIGNSDLINARSQHEIPVEPKGTLSDYVPFYFTPFSMMLFNIHTGHRVQKRDNREIIFFVSSIFRLHELGLPFVFTNQHAYAVDTQFFREPKKLDQIDWDILQKRDFSRSDADPGKQVRYQAEALVHERIPLDAILGISCFDTSTKVEIEKMVGLSGCETKVQVAPQMYF